MSDPELSHKPKPEAVRRLGPRAARVFREMRHLPMTTTKPSEAEAISLMTITVDFGITKLVDGNWSVHAVVRRDLFSCVET